MSAANRPIDVDADAALAALGAHASAPSASQHTGTCPAQAADGKSVRVALRPEE